MLCDRKHRKILSQNEFIDREKLLKQFKVNGFKWTSTFCMKEKLSELIVMSIRGRDN